VIVFLDTNIVIYLVQNPPVFGPRASAHLLALRGAGHSFAVSDLVRLECRMLPIRHSDLVLLSQYDTFFAAPHVQVLALTKSVCDRATVLRATYNFKTPDALQLGAAIVHGSDCFLTNDTRLSACLDIPVVVLP
jgi:predicted nucleic acid-binding protein